MTTPTLALGISAGGYREVEALARAVGDLKSNLQSLKTIAGGSSDLGGLQALAEQMKGMRQELNVALQGIRTELAGGFEKAFATTVKSVKEGAEKVDVELKKAAATLKVSSEKIKLGDGLGASISGKGLDSVEAVKQLRETARQFVGAQTEAAKEIANSSLAYRLKLATEAKKTSEAHIQNAIEEANGSLAYRLRMAVEQTKTDTARKETVAADSFSSIAANLKTFGIAAENAEAKIKASIEEANGALAYRLRLASEQAMVDESRQAASAANAFSALAYRLRGIGESEEVARSKMAASIEEANASLAYRLKLELNQQKTDASRLQAQQEEMNSSLAYRLTLQAESLKNERQMLEDAAKEKAAADKKASAILLAQQTVDAAYLAASDKSRARLALQARSQLDSGIDISTVASRFGTSATSTATGSGLDVLRNQVHGVDEEVRRLTPGLVNMAGAMNDAHSAARGLASGFGAMWLTWGNIAPLLAGAAISHSFTEVIKLGAQVQHTFEVIRVLSSESIESVGKLSDQMLELARSGPFGPEKIAEAMKTLSLAGLSVVEVGSAIKDVLNFSVAGDTSIAQAAEVMTTVGVSFKIAAADYNYIGDVIAKAAAVSKSSVESMGNAFKSASTVNSLYGVSLKDVGVNLALLANAGIQNSAAGTSLTNMYIDLAGRTPKATKALKELGVEAIDPLTGKMRDLGAIYRDLLNALALRTPTAQLEAINNIFAQRSRKDVVAIVDAMRTAAKEGAPLVISEFDRIYAEISDAAGFTIAASIALAQTPLNQMKSVAATMQATMVEAFKGIEPYVISVTGKLKEMFNSPEFRNGLERIVVGIGQLTQVFVEHIGIVTGLLALYVGFKIVSFVADVFVNLAEKTALYTLASTRATVATDANIVALNALSGTANVATTSVGRLAAAQELQNIAGASGAGNMVKVGAGLSGILAIGSKFLPWLTAAWLAWEAYSFWSGKAIDKANAVQPSTFQATLDALQKEVNRINEVNKAKREGISLDVLARNTAIDKAMADTAIPVQQAQARVNALENGTGSKMIAGNFNYQYGSNAVVEQAKLTKARQDLVAAQQLQVRQVGQLKDMYDALRLATTEQASRIAAEQVKRNGANPSGLLESPGKVDKGSASHDNSLAALKTQSTDRFAEIKKEYDAELKLLEERHRDGIASEGSYQAELLLLSTAGQNKVLKEVDDDRAKYAVLWDARASELAVSLAKSPDKLHKAMSNLLNEYEVFDAGMDKRIKASGVDMFSAQEHAANSLQKEIIKLTETNNTYWLKAEANEKKDIDQIKIKQELAGASEDVRVRAEAEMKVQDRYSVKLSELGDSYAKAQKDVADFNNSFGASDAGAQPVNDQVIKVYQELVDKVALLGKQYADATTEVDKFKKAAGGAAVADLAVKQMEDMRKTAVDMGKTVTSKLADAILAGGKDGGKSLVAWLKDYLLKQPLKVILQGVLQPIGNLVSNVAMSAMGLGTQGANGMNMLSGMGNVSSTIGNYLGGGNVGALSGWMSGSMSTANMTGSVAANAAGTGIDGLLLSNGAYGTAAGAAGSIGGIATDAAFAGTMAEAGGAIAGTTAAATGLTGAMAGITGALAAIPVWGWVALAAIAIFSGGGHGPKTDSGYDPGGLGIETRFGTPDAAKAVAKGMDTGFEVLAKQLGLKNTSLGAGVFISQDPNGTAKTLLQVATPNYNRNDRLGGIENVGRSDAELQAAVAEETTRAIFAGLKASDLEQRFKDFLSKVDLTGSVQPLTDAITAVLNVSKLDQILSAYGAVFENLRGRSVVATQAIADLSGGFDQLTANATAYYSNFFSEEEKRQNIAKNISETLSKAGLNISSATVLADTKAQFRALVEQYAAMGDAGQTVYAALLSVAGAFASIQVTTTNLTGSVTDLNNALELTNQQILDNVVTARNKLIESYGTEISKLESTTTQMGQFAISLSAFRDNLLLGDLSTLTPGEKYATAQQTFEATYAKAMQGDPKALADLQNAAQAFLQASRTYNASGSAYTTDFQKVQDALTATAALASTIKSSGDLQLDALKAQVTLLQGIAGGQLTIAEAIKNYSTAIIAALNAGLKVNPTDISALINALAHSGTASPDVLVNALVSAITTTMGANQQVNPAYTDALGLAINTALAQGLQPTVGALQALTLAVAALLNAGVGPGSNAISAVLGGATGFSNVPGIGTLYQSTAGAYGFNGTVFGINGTSGSIAQIQASVNAAMAAGNGIGIYNGFKSAGLTMAEADYIMQWPSMSLENWATSQGLPLFAGGAAFSNGVVSRPTAFNVGVMGEHGSEAVMPLANVGGHLGVRSAPDPAMVSMMNDLVLEVRMMREQNVQAAKAQIQSNYDANAKAASTVVEGNHRSMSRVKWEERMADKARSNRK